MKILPVVKDREVLVEMNLDGEYMPLYIRMRKEDVVVDVTKPERLLEEVNKLKTSKAKRFEDGLMRMLYSCGVV